MIEKIPHKDFTQLSPVQKQEYSQALRQELLAILAQHLKKDGEYVSRHIVANKLYGSSNESDLKSVKSLVYKLGDLGHRVYLKKGNIYQGDRPARMAWNRQHQLEDGTAKANPSVHDGMIASRLQAISNTVQLRTRDNPACLPEIIGKLDGLIISLLTN